MSLLRGASCPNRVRVLVYQELDAGDLDVHSAAARHARGEEEMQWVYNLRILTSDDASKTSMGSLFAWQELMSGTSGSKWTLVTRPGVQADVGWDLSMVEAWHDARVGTLREIPVLTVSLPASKRSTFRRNSSSGALGVARDWMNAMSASSQQSIQGSPKHVFTVVSDFRGRIPELSHRTFPRIPPHPVPTLAASGSMLFGPVNALSRAMRAYPCGEEPIADYAVDWVLSSMLWSSGARFFAPPTCPFSETRTRDLRPARWDSKVVGRVLQKFHAQYAEFAGVDLEDGLTSGRARMGLLPALESEDILSKFGSRATFDRIRRGFV